MIDPNRFGMLTVLPRYRLCRCDCGNEKVVRIDHLTTGKTISCGCEKARRASERLRVRGPKMKHGGAGTRAYSIWSNMRARCNNPKDAAFSHYGGRGISVCDRWNKSFAHFIQDIGHPGPGLTLDRIDNDGNYEPGNCRWVDRQTQMNNRRSNVTITHLGRTQTVAQWARETGIPRNTIEQRRSRNYPLDRVFSEEKYKNIGGLSLGGKANGDRMLALTHCKNGHPFDEANTRFSGKQRVCRACHRARARASRAGA